MNKISLRNCANILEELVLSELDQLEEGMIDRVFLLWLRVKIIAVLQHVE